MIYLIKGSLFHLIIDYCKHLIRSFKQVQVRFVRRFANGVAHLVAQTTRSLTCPREWLSSSLEFISHVMLVDCSS